MELLFFAYRDFTSDPDAVLAEYGFGRAHHRVLHFVDRHPGLRVADLLVILRITKQSLARVLKQLVDEGFILQEEDPTDRRARLLYTTAKGQALYDRLIELQLARIHDAAASVGPAGLEQAREFLFEMIAHEHRDRIEHLMRSANPGRSPSRRALDVIKTERAK